MPVAVRRAIVAPAPANEAAVPGQRSARSDRRGAEALDVISVSPVPDGPFGHDLRYGRPDGRVNGLVHEVRTTASTSIHEFCTDVDGAWTRRWTAGERRPRSGRQPPIANISSRGNREE